MDRVVELAGGRGVVPEGLLDDHARVLRESGGGEPMDHGAEQERRDLQVEDRALGIRDRRRHALERGGVGEIAGHVGEPLGEALEDLLVHVSTGLDRLPRALAQVVDRPVVDRHADDRAVQQAAALQLVQRPEGHHLREVAGDAEHDEHVGGLLPAGRAVTRGAGLDCGCHRARVERYAGPTHPAQGCTHHLIGVGRFPRCSRPTAPVPGGSGPVPSGTRSAGRSSARPRGCAGRRRAAGLR